MNKEIKNHCVIILNYNDWETCHKLIEHIKDYSNIQNIVVVDNCSTDNSLQALQQLYTSVDKVVMLAADKNGGYAYGNNLGCFYAIEQLGADYLTIANPDIGFSEETLDKMLDCVRDKEKAGIVSCKMHCQSNVDLPQAWKIPRYSDCILENLMILRRLVGNPTRYDESHFSDPCVAVDALPGSFFSFSGEVFRKVSGFDEETFLYYEENILAYKLKREGYINYLLTDCGYDHMHSVSIDKTFSKVKQKFELAHQSQMVYAKKYLKCNKLKLGILNLTFKIGLADYMLVKAFMNRRKA